jgi:hypothetical protein
VSKLVLGIALLAAGISMSFAVGGLPQSGGDTSRFVALQLKVTALEVTLIRAVEFPGAARPDPKSNAIEYSLLAADGSVLGGGSMENPRFQRSCSEEIPGSGTLTESRSTTDEGVTVLRLPVNANLHSIEFFTPVPANSAPAAQRQSLGKIQLQAP